MKHLLRSTSLAIFFGLSLFFVQSMTIVHNAVHSFHTHLVEHETQAELHDHAHSNGHLKVVEGWVCDLWDSFSHSAFSTTAQLVFDLDKPQSPGLVLVSTVSVQPALYPSYWGRAPPLSLDS
jgi:hypothetical protein